MPGTTGRGRETVPPRRGHGLHLAANFGPLPPRNVRATGYGGGTRPSSIAPNICRLLLARTAEAGSEVDQVVEIVCHLDDQSPEDLPIIIEQLMAQGALDAAVSPLFMKKGRSAMALTVLAAPHDAERLADMVLTQTTTLGVRLRPCERRMLPREVITVDSPWGQVRVKRAKVGETWRYHPEADDVAAICREQGLPPAEVRQAILRAIDGG